MPDYLNAPTGSVGIGENDSGQTPSRNYNAKSFANCWWNLIPSCQQV